MWIIILLAIVIGFIVLPSKTLLKIFLFLVPLAIVVLLLLVVLPILLPLIGGLVMLVIIIAIIVASIAGILMARSWFQNR